MKLLKVLRSAFVAGIISFASFSAFGQGAYLKLGGGYNIGIGSEVHYQHVLIIYSSPAKKSEDTDERVNHNYGKGPAFGAGLGYMFSENIGTELNIEYLWGGKNALKEGRIIYDDHLRDNPNLKLTETEAYSRMLLFQPGLVLRTGGSSIKPYLIAGPALAKGRIFFTYKYTETPNISELKSEYYGNWGIGFRASVGAEMDLAENLAFFGEVTGRSLSYIPTKGEIKNYTYNGKDEMFMLSEEQIHFKFADVVEKPNNNYHFSTERPKINFIHNTVGLNLGIKYNF